jgi:DMSO/TMAO reductase YedYZ molybdopterin-dependent catalytic subunit
MSTSGRHAARAGLAGLAAAAAALGIAELGAAVFPGALSPIEAVGGVVVDGAPPVLTDFAVETFGFADKAVLIAGVLTITAAMAFGLGVLAARWFVLGAAGVAGLALVAGATALRDVQAQPWAVAAVAVLGAVTGIGVLALLLRAATDPGETPVERPKGELPTRRRFLAFAAAAVAVGAISAAGGRVALERQRLRLAVRDVELPSPARPLPPPAPGTALAADGLSPLFTPNSDFYRVDTALSVPRIDPADWTLRVTGRVQRELELSYDDLLDRELVEADITIACVSNSVGGGLVGNARWLGTSLRDLLLEAGPQVGGSQVVGRAVDGWTAGFRTDLALDGREALIAVGMNGEPLPPVHGFPARLVVPGLFGYVSATKWLVEIELTGWEDYDAYWIPRGWDKFGTILAQSRFDTPGTGARLTAGPHTVAGVAWDTEHGISGVEVAVDDEPWQRAEISDPLADTAWRQWTFDWEATPGTHVLKVRAIDGRGVEQTPVIQPPRPFGATGHHTIRVRVG